MRARQAATYHAEVDRIVNVMEQKPEGVLLSNEEITDMIGFPFQDTRFRHIVNKAIGKLGLRKIPVRKIKSVGIYRVTPGDAVDQANTTLGKSHIRAAKKAFKQLQSVELTSLSANDQTVYIAAHMKAQMAVNLASEGNHLVLMDEIKAAGNKPIDIKATCLRLLDHNQ
jgi:hypothetical protein